MQYLTSFFFILILNITVTLGQTLAPQTEIIIIGTIHTGNKHFNHNTLYKTLKKYKPDIILWEQSTNFKRVFGLRIANFLKIWKPGIEQLSLQKYTAHNKNIKVLPFDTSFTSRRQYIRDRLVIQKAFFESLDNTKMSISDSTIYANYIIKRNHYFEFISNTDLIRINKPDVVDMTRVLYNLEIGYIIPLGKKYITDSLIAKQFEDDLTFWFARNNYMTKKIIEYSKEFEGQRIIILTGLNHKYYLQDNLLEQESKTTKIIELEDR